MQLSCSSLSELRLLLLPHKARRIGAMGRPRWFGQNSYVQPLQLSYRIASAGRGTGRDDAVDFRKILGREHNVRGAHFLLNIAALGAAVPAATLTAASGDATTPADAERRGSPSEGCPSIQQVARDRQQSGYGIKILSTTMITPFDW